MKIPVEKRKELSDYFSKQEGQNYHPCSNPCVLCGFFGTIEQWENFVKSKKMK